MPAHDICEPAVIAALKKEGWAVVDKQIAIELDEDRYLLADLRIQRHSGADAQQIFIVEVKCFTHEETELREFYIAMGQYILYRNALKIMGIDQPVYLAIPERVYKNFFRQIPVQASIKDVKMKLIVVDLEREEVVLWLH